MRLRRWWLALVVMVAAVLAAASALFHARCRSRRIRTWRTALADTCVHFAAAATEQIRVREGLEPLAAGSGARGRYPRRRGEGLARLVARVGLDAAIAAGVPALLETTNPDNVAMYERSGWRVTVELRDIVGLTVWVLQYD